MARRSKVWVDTSFLYALLDADDRNHAAAKEALSDLGARTLELFSSDHVLAEAYTLARKRLGWAAAQDALALFEVLRIRLLFGNRAICAAAGKWASWKDQDFSFVDCLSFAWMKDTHVAAYLSFDHHFQIAGFENFLSR